MMKNTPSTNPKNTNNDEFLAFVREFYSFASAVAAVVGLKKYEQILDLYNKEYIYMDKQIAKIQKENTKVGKDLKNLKKADKKRDPACEYGEKMLKKKHKGKK